MAHNKRKVLSGFYNLNTDFLGCKSIEVSCNHIFQMKAKLARNKNNKTIEKQINESMSDRIVIKTSLG